MRLLLFLSFLFLAEPAFCWGFYAHRQINYHAVFLLPPAMLVFFKPHIDFLTAHAVDPDKRRYAVAEEGPRHYIDIDHYGAYPFDSLPRKWEEALTRFGPDSLQAYGILPWWIGVMEARLTAAFARRDAAAILRLSAEIGHYLADAHVPLHACSNHNGQLTGQLGIHAFWESRIPELLAEREWDFFIGSASFLSRPADRAWRAVLESSRASDTVLRVERQLTARLAPSQQFAVEERNGKPVRQYSAAYTQAYDRALGGMVERRMRQSIQAVADFWYTAWVNAGQPSLAGLELPSLSAADEAELAALDSAWRRGRLIGREE